jgi:hypothetical protein
LAARLETGLSSGGIDRPQSARIWGLCAGGEVVLEPNTAGLALNQWHLLRIEAAGLNLRVYLDGRFELECLDPAPHEMGGRYRYVGRNAVPHFDNSLAQVP